jgi:hypothetical protein
MTDNTFHLVALERHRALAKAWLALAVQLEAEWALLDEAEASKAGRRSAA